MTTWDASWRPAQGDRVRSSRTGHNGTIVDVKFGGFLVAYDEPTTLDLADPDWHRRDDLEPVGDTADRLRREHAPRLPGAMNFRSSTAALAVTWEWRALPAQDGPAAHASR